MFKGIYLLFRNMAIVMFTLLSCVLVLPIASISGKGGLYVEYLIKSHKTPYDIIAKNSPTITDINYLLTMILVVTAGYLILFFLLFLLKSIIGIVVLVIRKSDVDSYNKAIKE